MRNDADEPVNVSFQATDRRKAKVNQGDAVDFDVKHEVPKTATRGIFSFSF